MKINKLKLLICLTIVMAIIGIIIYFNYAHNKQNDQEKPDIKYEKINMITNFRLGISNFDSINPHITQNKDILQIDTLIFEPLLEITEDYKIKNCLAKEWSKISNKSYVIKLKENIKWQDNTDFSADDVKYTIENIKKDKKSIYLENVKHISKVDIVDSSTIRIELDKEIPFFEYQLIFPILSKKQYEGQDLQKSTQIPMGTGKYKITKLEKDIIELIKNEKWYKIEDENPNIKNITVTIFETMGEVYNSFRLGNIDLVHTGNVNYEEYIGSMGYQKKQYKGREYDYISFNCQNPVLKDNNVRLAIQKAIDKEKIISSVLENRAYTANFPLDYGSYMINDIQIQPTFNKQEVYKILNDAGWKYEYDIWSKEIEGRTRTLNFNLIVNKENQQRTKVAEEIKEQLKSIGIQISIQKLSKNDYEKILETHQYEIILTGVYNGYSPELESFFAKGNIANYENIQIQKILQEIQKITTEEMQKEEYKKIIEIYNKEVPYIGLYRNQVTVAYGQTVRGDVTPNNYQIFYNFSNWYRQ